MPQTLSILATACALVLAGQNDADSLYQARQDLTAARRAAAIWAQTADVEYASAWKLSRVDYWIGTHSAALARDSLREGISASETAVRLDSARPEGHFWLAANLSAVAQSSGPFEALKYIGRVRHELETAIAIDWSWEEGSAEAALGQWYLDVPRLLGGSRSRAQHLLDHVLSRFPENKTALVTKARERLASGHPEEARDLLHRVIERPGNPLWAPEDRELERQAAEQLNALSGTGRAR